MKRPGSRRYKAEARGAFAFPEWHEGVPPAREEVGIDFLCERKGHAAVLVGRARAYTFDGADSRPLFEASIDGALPFEAGRPDDQPKVLLICPRCGNEREISAARIKAALDSMWAPHARRVESFRI